MLTLHLANTHVESEFFSPEILPLEKALLANRRLIQLQFLPLLYADEEDALLVTHLPSDEYVEELLSLNLFKKIPSFMQIDERSVKQFKVQPWAASMQVEKWAKKRGFFYDEPPFEVVKKVNSKAFTFEHCPQLDSSKLVRNEEELEEVLKKRESKIVLKSCFGVAGRGHFFIEEDFDPIALKRFAEMQFSQDLPLIVEPWLLRVLDFSTQWKIGKDKNICYLGATRMGNSSRGTYLGTITGPEQELFASFHSYIEVHKTHALSLLEKIAGMGYYGYVGLDAFLYQEKGEIKLYPIVEMNARRTLGLAALEFQARFFKERILTLKFASFSKGKSSLIPSKVYNNRQEIAFPRGFFYDFINPSLTFSSIPLL